MLQLDFLPENARRIADELGDRLTGVRLRPGQCIYLTYPGGDIPADVLDARMFVSLVSSLMGHSLYACQNELDMAYFTLPDGSRAGICGRFTAGGPRSVADISSVTIRIAREIKGCADAIIGQAAEAAGTLIISKPGLGKTTMLRDIARSLSEKGKNVCIIDERGEIAACRSAVPSLDVGPRTDVMTGCEKRRGLMLALRSCAPDVLITDEIGSPGDAEAIEEAARCGVQVIASAHGASLDEAMLRPCIMRLITGGTFTLAALLGPSPGQIAELKSCGKGCEVFG